MKKNSLVRDVLQAIKALGSDYNTEDKEIAKQVADIEKVQAQIRKEQKEFDCVIKTKVGAKQSGIVKVEKLKKNKELERE